MGYPGFFESVLFAQKWGRDRIEPRDLTADEQADIAILRDAIREIGTVRAKLDRLSVVEFKVDHTPRDTIAQLDWEIEMLEESVREIERVPEDEAERAEWERDA
jgi:N-methylhydantoinase B/oxoprolinase/acetone carboxylase alpha subunit